jgi:hypothetical protein
VTMVLLMLCAITNGAKNISSSTRPNTVAIPAHRLGCFELLSP